MGGNPEEPNIFEAINGSEPLLWVFLEHPGNQGVERDAEVVELVGEL